jgi:hypothetical protein
VHDCLEEEKDEEEEEEEEEDEVSGNLDVHGRIHSIKNDGDNTKMLTGLNKLCVGYSVGFLLAW